jgi:hypothetical protein
MTRTLALSWADRGVRVNVIAPGWLLSHLPRSAPYGGADRGLISRFAAGRLKRASTEARLPRIPHDGTTPYPEAGGLENARAMAAHESSGTTDAYPMISSNRRARHISPSDQQLCFLGRQERLLQGPHQSRMTWSSGKSRAAKNISMNDLKYIRCESPDLDSFFTNTLKN